MNSDWTMSTPVHGGEGKQICILCISKDLCVPTGANFLDNFLLYCPYSTLFSTLQDAMKH